MWPLWSGLVSELNEKIPVWYEKAWCVEYSGTFLLDAWRCLKITMQFIFQSSHLLSGNKGGQKPWRFGLFVHRHNPDFGVAWGKMSFQSHDGSDFVPRGHPALQWLQHQLFRSSSFSHALHPPSLLFLVTTNLETKNSRNVRNCGIHFSEIVSLFCKIASYIIYPSKTCYLFNITWQGLNSWEIARLDPHSNCRGFDESICRLVSSACVTGANCVCIGFIISNITCWPGLLYRTNV